MVADEGACVRRSRSSNKDDPWTFDLIDETVLTLLARDKHLHPRQPSVPERAGESELQVHRAPFEATPPKGRLLEGHTHQTAPPARVDEPALSQSAATKAGRVHHVRPTEIASIPTRGFDLPLPALRRP